MKTIKFPALILIVLFAITCKGQPKMQFDEKHHDFGDQKIEQKLKHTFTFKNIGTSTLIIEKVKAGWGCTGTLLSSEEIPAGGSGEIEVTLKTGKRTKKLRKTISIYTNNPDKKNKIVRITVSANVIDKK